MKASVSVTACLIAASLVLGGGAVLAITSDREPKVELEVPVTPMNHRTQLFQNSPTIVADPTEPRFLALANRYDADFSCALQISGDGGAGWISANPVPKLPKGADKCYAPEVAFDSNGKLYYLFVGLKEPGNEPMGVFLSTSSDRARTFSSPHKVLGPLNFGVRMVIDQEWGKSGRIHLVWLEARSDPPLGGFGPPPNPIMVAHSDDGGNTFSPPLQISDPHRRFIVAPSLALGPDQSVHVAYYDLNDDARDYLGLEGPPWEGSWTLVLSSSSDGGRSFRRGKDVDSNIRTNERVLLVFTMPPASVVTYERTVCLAWSDSRYGDLDALFKCSEDEGNAWSPPRRLNDDSKGNGRSQFLPRLSFSPDGRLDAIFYDRRRDRHNVLNDVYFTSLPKGARRIAENVRLTRDNFESRIGPQYLNVSALGRADFGSRLGLLSLKAGAVAAWTDTRNAKALFQEQNIFATRIRFSNRRGEFVPPALFLAFAVLWAWALLRRRSQKLALQQAVDETRNGDVDLARPSDGLTSWDTP